MQIVRCKNCGAQLDISKAIGGVVACEYCNSKHTLAKSKDEQAINFLAIAEHELDNGKFDEAFSAYSKAASIDKAEPEAYYGMALASNKVRYIKDVNNNRLQPIIYDATNKSFEKDSNYIKALNLATPEQKEEYTKRAKEIDYIRNEFYKLKQEGKEYDVFICVKVTDDTTKRKTIDSERANDIYYHLKDKGYKPFYSEREIQNETGVDYEARILYALYSSPCMIVICSDESYLQTPWVKNEYSRFISLINDEQKESNSIAIGFFDKPIEKLPNRNGRLQGVCLKNPDAYSKIVDFVDKHYNAEAPQLNRKTYEQANVQKKAVVKSQIQKRTLAKYEQTALSVSEKAKLDIAKSMLDSGNYDAVISRCKSIIETNKSCALAYWYYFLAENGCKNSAEFEKSDRKITSFDNLESAIATAESEQKSECYNALFNRAMADKQLYIYTEYIALPDSAPDKIEQLTAAYYSKLISDEIKDDSFDIFDTIIKTVSDSDTYVKMNVEFADKLFFISGKAALEFYKNALEVNPAHSHALWRAFVMENALYTADDTDNIKDAIDSDKLFALLCDDTGRKTIESKLFVYGFNQTAIDAMFDICLSEINNNISNKAQYFDFLLSLIPADQNDAYSKRIFDIVSAAIANKQFELAKVYNDRAIAENKLSDRAYFNRIYIKNKSINPFGFCANADALYDDQDFSAAVDAFGESNPDKENIYISFANNLKALANKLAVRFTKFIATYYDLSAEGLSRGVDVINEVKFKDFLAFYNIDELLIESGLFQRNENFQKAYLDKILPEQEYALSPKEHVEVHEYSGRLVRKRAQEVAQENARKSYFEKKNKKLISKIAIEPPERVGEEYLKRLKRQKIIRIIQLCILLAPALVSLAFIIGIIKPAYIFALMHYGIWIALGVVLPLVAAVILSHLKNKRRDDIISKHPKRYVSFILNIISPFILIIPCMLLAAFTTVTVSTDYEFMALKNSPTYRYILNVSNVSQLKQVEYLRINEYVINIVKDIDCKGEKIKPLEGCNEVNGNGHKISNFVISINNSNMELYRNRSGVCCGLFSCYWETPDIVKDLTIDGAIYNVEIKAKVDIICGAIYGKDNSWYNMDYKLSNCKVTNCIFDFSKCENVYNIYCNQISGLDSVQLIDCVVENNQIIYP